MSKYAVILAALAAASTQASTLNIESQDYELFQIQWDFTVSFAHTGSTPVFVDQYNYATGGPLAGGFQLAASSRTRGYAESVIQFTGSGMFDIEVFGYTPAAGLRNWQFAIEDITAGPPVTQYQNVFGAGGTLYQPMPTDLIYDFGRWDYAPALYVGNNDHFQLTLDPTHEYRAIALSPVPDMGGDLAMVSVRFLPVPETMNTAWCLIGALGLAFINRRRS